MNSFVKKVFFISLLFGLVQLTVGCDPEVGEALDDAYAAAPGFCKDYCSEYIDCRWDGSTYDGDAEDDAKDDSRRSCVLQCAYGVANGAYVVEYDLTSQEIDIKDHISGGTYKKYLECYYELDGWDCNDGNWGVEYDDEDTCEALEACAEILDIDFKWEWNDQLNICVSEGDESVSVF